MSRNSLGGWTVTDLQTPDLLTSEEVAELLRVSLRTVHGWRTDGEGPPFVQHGRIVRYRRDALGQWLAELEAASREVTA